MRNLIRMLNAESTVQPQPKEEGSMSKRAAKRVSAATYLP